MKKLLLSILVSIFVTLPLLSEAQQSPQPVPTLESLQAQYPGCTVTEEVYYDYSSVPTADSTTVLPAVQDQQSLGCIIIVVVVAVVFWGVTIYIVYRICKQVPTPPPSNLITNWSNPSWA